MTSPRDQLQGGSWLFLRPPPALAMVGLVLMTVLAGCGGTVAPNADTKGVADVVPWSALKPAPAAAPTPLPVPAGTADCTSADLTARFTGAEGLTDGQLIGGFVFSDRSSAPCQVRGKPTIQLRAADGEPITVRPGPDLLGNPPSSPVLLLPGRATNSSGPAVPGQASLVLTWPTLDPATGSTTCFPTPAVATSVTFTVPGPGGQVTVTAPLTGTRHPAPVAPCDGILGVSPFQAITANPTPPLLSARIQAPATVVAGQVLRYQVVLTNHSKAAVDFSRICAAYTESLAGGAGAGENLKVVEQYQLNCAAAGKLQPGHSIIFAMELATPGTASHVLAYLDWGLIPWSGFATGGPVGARVKIT